MFKIYKLSILFMLLINVYLIKSENSNDDLIEQKIDDFEEIVNLINTLRNSDILADESNEELIDIGSMEKIKRGMFDIKNKKSNSTIKTYSKDIPAVKTSAKNSKSDSKAKSNTKPGKQNVMTASDLERHRFVNKILKIFK